MADNNNQTKVISNHHIAPAIIDLLNSAEKYVVLVSPYFNFWRHLTVEIFECINRRVKVLLITSEQGFNQVEDKTSLSKEIGEESDDRDGILTRMSENGADVYINENLHTKLYISEICGIATSMNLYDWSMKSNEEMGIWTDDEDLLDQLNDYVKKLKKRCIHYDTEHMSLHKKIYPARHGHCIRCGKDNLSDRSNELDADEFLHLCDECEPIWIKYGENREYPEKYCFVCGNEHETSVKRPFCKDCTYDRKWNDDEYEEQVQKNIDKYIGDN